MRILGLSDQSYKERDRTSGRDTKVFLFLPAYLGYRYSFMDLSNSHTTSCGAVDSTRPVLPSIQDILGG